MERLAVRLGMRMVEGLANAHAATIVAGRADRPFRSVDDLWRRAGVPATSLVQLAEADAFRPAMGLAPPEALWAMKALRDELLPPPPMTRSPFRKRPNRSSRSGR